MNPRRLSAVARKETLHVVRDPRSLLMALALPLLLLFLFGYALTMDVDRVPFMVRDSSGTPESRELVSRFSGSRYFQLKGYARDYADAERALDRREILAFLVIPADFGINVASGRPAEVQFILDGSDSNTASIARGYAEAVTEDYSSEISLKGLLRTRGAAAKSLAEPPVDFAARVWFNPELESRNQIVPGLIAVITMVIAGLLTSLTVAREWENGTMEQLISTPVTGPELLIGKIVPYFAVGMFDVIIAVALGRYFFGVPLRGSVGVVMALSSVFVAASLGMGILISTAARTQLLANQIAAAVTFLPSFLLSGFIYALRNMPAAAEIVSRAVPARYFIEALRGVYLKGLGLGAILGQLFFLAVFGVAMFAISFVKFKKRLD